jgi:hypothetical protein
MRTEVARTVERRARKLRRQAARLIGGLLLRAALGVDAAAVELDRVDYPGLVSAEDFGHYSRGGLGGCDSAAEGLDG